MLQINVASSVRLSDQQKKKLELPLQAKYPKEKIAFNYQVKEELIAGLSININGKLYDASLRARLDQLASKI